MIELHAQQVVLQESPAVDHAGKRTRFVPAHQGGRLGRGPAATGHFHFRLPAGHIHQRLARPAQRVEHRHPVCAAHKALRGLLGHFARVFQHLGVQRFRFFVHPLDRRPRQNIVELVQHHFHPAIGEGFVIKIKAFQGLGRRPPQFCLAQSQLALAVALLGLGLRGIRAAVRLEVQLAHVAFLRQTLLLQIGKELRRRRQLDLGQPFQVGSAAQELHVIALRAAAAIAPAKGQDERVDPVLLQAGVPAIKDRLGARLAVVIGEDVRRNSRAVDPFPPEGVIGERVAAAISPGNLLGSKTYHSAALEDLRQRAGITEHIRQPQHARIHAQLVTVELLPVHHLPDQRFAAAHVGVGLNPHSAIGNQPPSLDLGLIALIQLRVQRFHHHIQMRLALQEAVLRVLVKQRHLVDGCARHLALGFRQRPQPGHVNVRVPKGIHGRHARPVFLGQQACQPLAALAHRFQHFLFG